MGSLGGGHYTACGRGTDGSWYNFNDSHASATSPAAVLGGSVYILVYVRRKVDDSEAESMAERMTDDPKGRFV